jgi:hypothetical protein
MKIIINLSIFGGEFYFPKKEVLHRSCGYLKEIDEKCNEGCIFKYLDIQEITKCVL